jgi:hypothetical protein
MEVSTDLRQGGFVTDFGNCEEQELDLLLYQFLWANRRLLMLRQ